MTLTAIKRLFVVAGIYDGLLGLAFLFLAPAIFARFAITPPNHYGYIVFPALLLLVFAAMFFRIARDPAAYRHMIPYGIGLKAAYAGTAFWFQLQGNIPTMWIPMAWIDLAFLLLFVLALRALSATRAAA
jgi:hypothetical protein